MQFLGIFFFPIYLLPIKSLGFRLWDLRIRVYRVLEPSGWKSALLPAGTGTETSSPSEATSRSRVPWFKSFLEGEGFGFRVQG